MGERLRTETSRSAANKRNQSGHHEKDDGDDPNPTADQDEFPRVKYELHLGLVSLKMESRDLIDCFVGCGSISVQDAKLGVELKGHQRDAVMIIVPQAQRQKDKLEKIIEKARSHELGFHLWSVMTEELKTKKKKSKPDGKDNGETKKDKREDKVKKEKLN